MKIISGVYWDRGQRSRNEDSLILEQVFTKKGRILLAAVSDGIGGLPEGETASGFILEKLLQNFYHRMLPLIEKGKGRRFLERSLLRCFFETNQILKKYAESKGITLGAAVSVLFIYRKKFLIFHLGDTRIYRICGKNNIEQITEDHVAENNALTKCIGSFTYQVPDIIKGRIGKAESFLLCSDGFYHYAEKNMIMELLNPREELTREQIEKRLREMAGYGTRMGEQDNRTALYIRLAT